jgi:UDP:flavonoid glycosyltransferase YjiC (YdhE family)
MQGYRRIDFFKGARARCPLWAPAAVSRRCGKKTEDLKEQETREEVAESLAAQNMERDAPWTA